VAVLDLVAYSTGFEGRFVIRVPFDGKRTLQKLISDQFHFGHLPESGDTLPDELLRFGIEFADGRRGTTIRGRSRTAKSGVSLSLRGGSGDGSSWSQRFWVHPLPPPGPLKFVAEWPAADVPLTTIESDASPIVEAAGRSERYWEDDGLDWTLDEDDAD
jgi:hypothetical protein